jgi:aryl-alcohol dehydrogenase-like predicted oxidoreductase
LGQSGIQASVVGLGAWAIGGWMWGGTSEKESIETIHAAIDAGTDLIDTAPIYGFGLSERIVGKAIKDRRDKVVLATKCAMVCDTGRGEHKFNSDVSGPAENGHIHIQVCLHPESIRQELEESLRRLQTDCIDLYQTHWQDSTTPIEDTMATLLDLKQEGKIRAIGVSNATSEHMDQYRALGPIDSDQEKFSMLDQEIREDQLPYCHQHGIAILAYSPLAQGLLTGKMGPDREFEEGDQRRNNARYSVENRRRVADMLQAFEPIAEKHGGTLAQAVIAWTFHQDGVTHVLCGARHVGQAQENAQAGLIELGAKDLQIMNHSVEEYSGVLA